VQRQRVLPDRSGGERGAAARCRAAARRRPTRPLTSARMRRRVCVIGPSIPRSKEGGDQEKGLVLISLPQLTPAASAFPPSSFETPFRSSGSSVRPTSRPWPCTSCPTQPVATYDIDGGQQLVVACAAG